MYQKHYNIRHFVLQIANLSYISTITQCKTPLVFGTNGVLYSQVPVSLLKTCVSNHQRRIGQSLNLKIPDLLLGVPEVVLLLQIHPENWRG